MLVSTCPADRVSPHQQNRQTLAGVTASCELTRAAIVSGCFGPHSSYSQRRGLASHSTEIARRAGVGPGTVHRHFPTKEALYLAVATDQIEQLVAEGELLDAGGDPAAVFTLLSRMMATGAENAAVKSALEAAELDLRTAAPGLAADLTRRVADLLDRAHAAGAVREDLTVEELMALVAGAFAAIRHAGAETSLERSAHIAQLILNGLQPQRR